MRWMRFSGQGMKKPGRSRAGEGENSLEELHLADVDVVLVHISYPDVGHEDLDLGDAGEGAAQAVGPDLLVEALGDGHGALHHALVAVDHQIQGAGLAVLGEVRVAADLAGGEAQGADGGAVEVAGELRDAVLHIAVPVDVVEGGVQVVVIEVGQVVDGVGVGGAGHELGLPLGGIDLGTHVAAGLGGDRGIGGALALVLEVDLRGGHGAVGVHRDVHIALGVEPVAAGGAAGVDPVGALLQGLGPGGEDPHLIHVVVVDGDRAGDGDVLLIVEVHRGGGEGAAGGEGHRLAGGGCQVVLSAGEGGRRRDAVGPLAHRDGLGLQDVAVSVAVVDPDRGGGGHGGGGDPPGVGEAQAGGGEAAVGVEGHRL